MAILNQIPIENVSMADLRDTLGGTNELGSFFTRFNGYSKLKPVDNPAQMVLFNVYKDSYGNIQCDTDPTTGSGLIWGLQPNIHKGEGYFNGIVAEFYDNPGVAGAKYGNWANKNPKGGSSSPYRLADFRGYRHKAAFPFSIGVMGHEVVPDGASSYKSASTIQVNSYLEPTLTFFMTIKTDSDFSSMAKFFTTYKDHRLIVEMYSLNTLDDTSWKTALPTKVWASANTIGTMTYYREVITLNVANEMGLTTGSRALVLFGIGGNITAGGSTRRTHTDGFIGQFASPVLPYMRWLDVKSNPARRCNISRYRFGVGSYASSWYDATSAPPATYKGTPVIHMHLKIEKTTTSITVPSSSFMVRCVAYGGIDTNDTGYRTDDNGSSVFTGDKTIPATSAQNTFADVYWTFNNLITKTGYVSGFIIQVSNNNGSTWDNFSSINVGTTFV